MNFLIFCGKLVFLIITIIANCEASEYHVDILAVHTIVQSNSTSPQFVNFGRGLLELDAEIKAFKTSIPKLSSLTAFQKFGDIGRKLQKMRNGIYDQKIAAHQHSPKTSLEILNHIYHVLGGQMIEIRKSLKRDEDDLRLRVIKAIEDHQFKDAEDILVSIDDHSITHNVVSEICRNNTNSVNLLLAFTKFVSTLGRSLEVIMSLRNELEILGRLDLFSAIKLICYLKSEILNQKSFIATQHPDAINFYNDLQTSLRNKSTDMMTSAMLSHKFESDENITEILVQSYNLDSILANEILFEVIDRVYGKISNKEILDNIFFQRNSSQIEDALLYMYKKMRESNQLHTAIFKLAQYANHLEESKNLEVFSKPKGNNSAKVVLQSLPKSVQNLYSAESVCLKNFEVSEYLYAASDEFTFDNNRRRVFTWVPREKVTQGVWYVKKDFRSDDFYFVNKVHSNEYMYASEDYMGKGNRLGYVFTWKMKGPVDSKKSAWSLEISGDHLRIRNAFNNNLLCVTSNTYPQNRNEDRRYAFTVKNEIFVFDKSCLWVVESCE